MLRHAPWLALGPLTGPLCCAAIHYARLRRFGMATVCLLGVAEVWIGAPALLAEELKCIITSIS